jgi:hypothetical protein
MTRIRITDDVITIKRSDLPTMTPVPYPDHNLEAGVVSLGIDGHELFLNSANGYEQWIPAQEEYILQALSVLLIAREIEAELGVSAAEKLAADLMTLDPDTLSVTHIAEILVKRGWGKK